MPIKLAFIVLKNLSGIKNLNQPHVYHNLVILCTIKELTVREYFMEFENDRTLFKLAC